MLNDFLEKKETFFHYNNKNFSSPINRIFPKGLTHASEQKNSIFSIFCF